VHLVQVDKKSAHFAYFVLILVWTATFFIPSGEYKPDASGSPIAGSFKNVESPLDFKGRIEDLRSRP
jgi:hypothetical protein